jgi:hypothetical protein
MGKRVAYRRRSRRRPTRKQNNHRRKSQYRNTRRRQRGGVSDAHPTRRTVDGIPIENGTVVATPIGTMDIDTYIERQQKTDDPSLE